jgi:hypothetical protein
MLSFRSLAMIRGHMSLVFTKSVKSLACNHARPCEVIIDIIGVQSRIKGSVTSLAYNHARLCEVIVYIIGVQSRKTEWKDRWIWLALTLGREPRAVISLLAFNFTHKTVRSLFLSNCLHALCDSVIPAWYFRDCKLAKAHDSQIHPNDRTAHNTYDLNVISCLACKQHLDWLHARSTVKIMISRTQHGLNTAIIPWFCTHTVSIAWVFIKLYE